MKCPKCGYISFDHNAICPKCKKDISSERDRMNLSAYKADPPFLLGALLGEIEESETEADAPFKPTPEQESFSSQTSERDVREDGSEEFTIDLEDLAFEDYRTDEGQSEPFEADFIHLDELTRVELEPPLELEGPDSIRQQETDGLGLSPAGDQKGPQTLDLDLGLEETEEKSS